MGFNKSKVMKKIIFILFVTLLSACKNEVIDVMPYVQFEVTVSSGELATLGVGSSLLKDGGYAGLIIYRMSEDEFVVFERLCTYYPNDTAAVVLDKSQVIATCPTCGSNFILTDGSKCNNGPALLALKQYQCYYSNHRLTIVN
jgi:hypothetical protein